MLFANLDSHALKTFHRSPYLMQKLCTYQCFPPEEVGGGMGSAGIPWGLDQQTITSPGNLTEHLDT